MKRNIGQKWKVLRRGKSQKHVRNDLKRDTHRYRWCRWCSDDKIYWWYSQKTRHKKVTSLQIVPNIESVGTAKQADVAREAGTLTKLEKLNIASIYVIVLCDMVFQSSSFIVFVQGTSLLWPFHIWSLSSTDQGFLNHNWLPTIFFMKPAVSSKQLVSLKNSKLLTILWPSFVKGLLGWSHMDWK